MTLRQTSLAVITLLGLTMIAGAFFVSTGFLLIDEVIYMLSADTFRDTGSLVIQNGYASYPSEDLIWMDLLSIGPNGLVPQYPVGSAVVGAFFVGLFDQHGFFVMNALAAFGTLFVTRALALELFEDESVALGAILLLVFGSYFTEYAFGLWPHMVSVLSVTTSFWLFLRACRTDTPLLIAALSGLFLGAGLAFRVDGVLLVPVIGLLGVLYARKPVLVYAGGALGLVPGLAAMAYANAIKFGTWNPISYGGGDYASKDPLKYIGLITICLVGFAATLLVRAGLLRPSRWWGVLLVVLCAGAAFMLPQTGKLASQLVRGITGLIIDATTTIDARPGIQTQPDGTLLFWGLPKKALGQSMPWIGALCVLLVWPWAQRRRAITCILIFAALWMFPFVIRAWHGGLSLNMRYFLPVLPALCILAAWILKELMGNAIPRLFLFAIIAGFTASFLWISAHPTGTAGAHQILSTPVFLAVCALSLAAGVSKSGAGQIALLGIGFGIGHAVTVSLTDNLLAQAFRTDEMRDFSEETGRDVIYDVFVRSAARDPRQLFALPHWRNVTADPEFISSALSDGYRILMQNHRATVFLQTYPQFRSLAEVTVQDVRFQSIGMR
ncbi:MAG: hypothetical protein HKN27_04020 [Silicimonas sp.]|nr:hypothetical protein [Silicimonas sp.]